MIKIKIYELEKHRNETTFRAFLAAQNSLKEVGIEFTNGDSYDYAWIGQASFINKKVSLQQSVNDGLEFLNTVKGGYFLFDGQDSASLLGAYEVFKNSNALRLFKSSLLKDRSLYKKGLNLGRSYWGPGDYKLPDFDEYADRILLSGTNWLSTHWSGIKVNWYDINRPKQYDVSAMFQFPSLKKSFEHGLEQSFYYDKFREPGVTTINNLPSHIKVAKLNNGQRVSQQEYYNRTFNSKIIFAPFGYGEMAPRDLEAAMFGSILIKPDMSHIDTKPNVYIDRETYIACKHDFSDLEEKITEVLYNYKNYSYIIDNARKKYLELMHPNHIAIHLYEILKNLDGVTY